MFLRQKTMYENGENTCTFTVILYTTSNIQIHVFVGLYRASVVSQTDTNGRPRKIDWMVYLVPSLNDVTQVTWFNIRIIAFAMFVCTFIIKILSSSSPWSYSPSGYNNSPLGDLLTWDCRLSHVTVVERSL